MQRSMLKVALALVLIVPLTSCFTMTHRVGKGAQGTETVQQGQWFALWGLIPLGETDTQAMAGGATDYDIQTQQSFLDVIINIFTGLLPLHGTYF